MERTEPYTDEEIQAQIRDNDLYYELKEKTMEKTSVITRLEFKSPWTNPTTNQTVYYHNIWLENGDIGQIGAMAKEPDFLKEGQTLTYLIETNEKGNKIKRIQPPKAGKFDPEADKRRQLLIARQNTLQRAFDYYSNGWHQSGQKPSPGDLMKLAEEFTSWVMK